ncbi:mRNA cleavage and polyadenylation factor II complex, subunit CFT2 (CPSF subunit) [Ceraceosorus bombacis]|uniref:Cleavage and polyadenylation specificity factor subunit 2 n=1 Tax=Ceraceosorus bombacis TaxID=401625 RepID=A0A0P1BH40_9BASI|nr:mRNA cleavage and polyadenylation factor II complex, subunit CFT2 (CPSF subunit) [Ceraceosorus bombacis]
MITITPLSVPWASSQPFASTSTSSEPGFSLIPNGTSNSAASTERPKALAYLLDIDNVRILIGCGAPENFSFQRKDADNEGDEEAAKRGAHVTEERAQGEDEMQSDLPERLRGESLARRACTENFDTLLADLAPTIDLVLLCHSTLSHLGLYSYAWAQLGLKCPAFATLPVSSMGRLTVLEAVAGWYSELGSPTEKIGRDECTTSEHARIRRCLTSPSSIEESFDHIRTVRYLQPTSLDGKLAGITLTAYSAGHSLGGTLWKLRSPVVGTVMICLDWNHMRERHLDGTALIGAGGTNAGAMEAVRRADVLLADCERAMIVNPRRKDKDAALLDLVHNTIRSGHNVLMPVDASARLLELLVLLDAHWAYAYPNVKFPLCLISQNGKEVLERARALMEWTTKTWAAKPNEETDSGNKKKGKDSMSQPLEFKYLRVFSSLEAMDTAIPASVAKVILSVPLSLTHGPSRALLARFEKNVEDIVILTQRGEPGSLGRWLYDRWEWGQEEGAKWGRSAVGKEIRLQQDQTCEIKLCERALLTGTELTEYLEAEQAAKDREAAQKALRARTKRRLEADEEEAQESDSDVDSDASSVDGQGDIDGLGMGAGATGEAPSDGYGEPGGSRKRRRTALSSERDVRMGLGLQDGRAGGYAKEADEGAEGGTSGLSYDIYLRGSSARATNFFGANPVAAAAGAGGRKGEKYGVGVRYRLFPVVERKRRVDAYGETIDISRWLERGREMEELAGDPNSANGPAGAATARGERYEDPAIKAKRLEAEKKAKEEAERPPAKIVGRTISFQPTCRFAFVEMSGLADGRALKTLLPQLLPRRLVLVGGDEASKMDAVKSFSAIEGMTKEIFAPSLGQFISIGELTTAYTLNLGEGLMTKLKFSKFEDYEVANVLEAKLRFGMESNVPSLELLSYEADGDKESEMNTNDESTGATSGSIQTLLKRPTKAVSSTLFIGDLHLASLRALLSTPPFRTSSEFAGQGSLICGIGAWQLGLKSSASGTASSSADGGENPEPSVSVRKESKGNVLVEGNVGVGFYRVRDAVYKSFARVDT